MIIKEINPSTYCILYSGRHNFNLYEGNFRSKIGDVVLSFALKKKKIRAQVGTSNAQSIQGLIDDIWT